MLSIFKELNKDQDFRMFLEDIFIPEREIISNGGNMWILGDIVITKDDVKKICNDRIKALVKLLPGSTNCELKYIKDSIRDWKDLKEFIALLGKHKNRYEERYAYKFYQG